MRRKMSVMKNKCDNGERSHHKALFYLYVYAPLMLYNEPPRGLSQNFVWLPVAIVDARFFLEVLELRVTGHELFI